MTDLAGRQVALPERVECVMLGKGRELTRCRVVTMGDCERLDAGYAQFGRAFPALTQSAARQSSGRQQFQRQAGRGAPRPQVIFLGLTGRHARANAT